MRLRAWLRWRIHRGLVVHRHLYAIAVDVDRFRRGGDDDWCLLLNGAQFERLFDPQHAAGQHRAANAVTAASSCDQCRLDGYIGSAVVHSFVNNGICWLHNTARYRCAQGHCGSAWHIAQSQSA